MEYKEFHPENEIQYDKSSSLKWVLSHIKPYPLIVSIFLAVIVCSVLFQNQAYIYLGKIFDLLKTDPKGNILWWILLFIIASIGQGLLHLGSSYSILFLRLRVERDMRKEIYADLLGKSQTFLDSKRIGELMALATNELRNISIMFQPGFNISLKGILSYIIPLGFILFNFDWQLFISPLLFTIISMWLLYRYSGAISKITFKIREKFGILNADLNEALDGIETIKANSKEKYEKEAFKNNAENVLLQTQEKIKKEVNYFPTLVFAVFFGIALLQALLMFVDKSLTLGQLISYISIYSSLRFPIQESEATFSMIGAGMASAQRIVDTLRASADIDHREETKIKDIEGKIEFRNVYFKYGDGDGKEVLKNISFTVDKHKTLAIVGMTGSGKSTIAKLINRTYDVTDGEILIDGINVKEWDLHHLRSLKGIIEQDIFLFSRSINHNIAFSEKRLHLIENASDELEDKIVDCAKKANAHGFIELFPDKYDTVVGERGTQLSGGQRQRIAISRALLKDPKILILDDSTSAVDSNTEAAIKKGLWRVMKNRTTILITNKISLIRWAHKIIVMKNGEIKAQGGHKELLQHCEEYRELFPDIEDAGEN